MPSMGLMIQTMHVINCVTFEYRMLEIQKCGLGSLSCLDIGDWNTDSARIFLFLIL
jgi:hypothetical protein